MVKKARVIPENERWLHTPSVQESLKRAVEWASRNKPKESDLDRIERRLKKAR